MITTQMITDLMRGPDLASQARARGYQVTVLRNCDSIYIADPDGIGVIFDTRTGIELLKKLAVQS